MNASTVAFADKISACKCGGVHNNWQLQLQELAEG